MSKPLIQIDDVVREMTDEEHQLYLATQTQQAEQEAEAQAKIDARQSALAKLALIGLTEEEISAL
jgi:cytidylate kinase